MFEERELLGLLLGCFAAVAMIRSRDVLGKLPNHTWLLAAFSFHGIAWMSTVVEGICLPWLLNLLQHLSSAIGTVCLAWWCCRLRKNGWKVA
jgi:hypothetical protein